MPAAHRRYQAHRELAQVRQQGLACRNHHPCDRNRRDELARLAAIYDVSVAWLLGETPEALDAQDPRLELAARELTKLRPDDLERLLKLLAAMRSDSPANGDDRG